MSDTNNSVPASETPATAPPATATARQPSPPPTTNGQPPSDLPLVSIIIPCYNAAEYVAEAIQSALDQTYPNCEVIVIDDGSTDGSLEVIKSFGGTIRWETGPNQGGCAARNRGLELARGEWIQFLDSDDRITTGKVASQVNALKKSAESTAMAVCGWRHFTERGLHPLADVDVDFVNVRGVDLVVALWLGGGMFPLHSWLTPKALIDRMGCWNTDLAADQDGEFFGKMLVGAGEVRFVPDEEAHYRKPGPGNVSSRINERAVRSRFEAWNSVQKCILVKRNDREARRSILRRLRAVTYQARDFPEIVQQAHLAERQVGLLDFDPNCPPIFQTVCGLFGLRAALSLRKKMKRMFRCLPE
jgi:hypothetical protein